MKPKWKACYGKLPYGTGISHTTLIRYRTNDSTWVWEDMAIAVPWRKVTMYLVMGEER